MSATRPGLSAWLSTLLRAFAYAVTAAVFAAPLSVVEGALAAAIGAAVGSVVGRVLADGRGRSYAIVAGCALACALAFALGDGIVGSETIAALLGPARALRVAEVVVFASGALAASSGVRVLSARRRWFAVIEVALIALAFAALVLAHRHGAIHRPYEIADPILSIGMDPVLALVAIGAGAASVIALLLLSERSLLRSALHLGVVALLLLFVAALTQRVGLQPPPDGDALHLRDDPEARTRGQGGTSPPDFEDEYDPSQAQVPLAVVLLHDDYSPPSGIYYFRQDAFSQYNGRRLVSATREGVDEDIAPGFPTRTIDVSFLPPPTPRAEPIAGLGAGMGDLLDVVGDCAGGLVVLLRRQDGIEVRSVDEGRTLFAGAVDGAPGTRLALACDGQGRPHLLGSGRVLRLEEGRWTSLRVPEGARSLAIAGDSSVLALTDRGLERADGEQVALLLPHGSGASWSAVLVDPIGAVHLVERAADGTRIWRLPAGASEPRLEVEGAAIAGDVALDAIALGAGGEVVFGVDAEIWRVRGAGAQVVARVLPEGGAEPDGSADARPGPMPALELRGWTLRPGVLSVAPDGTALIGASHPRFGDRLLRVQVPVASETGAFRSTVETTVGLLADHPRPFALEAPIQLVAVENPDAGRFRRTYRVRSAVLTSDEWGLLGRAAGDPSWPAEVRAHYTRAPSDPRYRELAERIVSELPEPMRDDPFARAVAISRWLGREGTYSLRSRHASAEDPTAHFLFGDRTGYCVHFAHATAFLLRSLGLPARVATGYMVPESSRRGGSAILISGQNSHAWAELYLEGVGWVVVDVAPERALDPPPQPADEQLQRLLAEMLRGLRPLSPDGSEPARPIEEVIARVRGPIGAGALALLALLIVAGYVVKGWRRLAPAFVRGPALARVSYRAALDVLSERGMRRRWGESREAFAARLAARLPSLAMLTARHSATAWGGRGRGGTRGAEAREMRRAVAAVRRESARLVPWWRRALGVLDPWSWLRTR